MKQLEYLVDKITHPFTTIAYTHKVELLAGIIRTSTKLQQHVMNEVSHALHKLLIFNKNISNPFQKWT